MMISQSSFLSSNLPGQDKFPLSYIQGSSACMDETRNSPDRQHRNMTPAFADFLKPVLRSSGDMGSSRLKPDNQSYLLILIATLAGAMMVIFTEF